MAKQRYQVRNWPEYNKALVQRGSLTFWFSQEVVEGWRAQGEEKSQGRPWYYSELAICCGLTLRQLYRLSLRATQGLVESLVKLSGLEVLAPNYTTLCRRGKGVKVKLGVKSVERARHVLVDSTGIQIIGEGEWKRLRYGLVRRQVWKKLHMTLDADEQLILSAEMTDSERLDGNYLAGLLGEIEGEIGQLTGDGAYDKKGCYQAIYQRPAKAVIPPQHNAIVQRNKYKKDPALAQGMR